MTTQKPAPEEQNSPKAPDSSQETRPTGFFNRVRRELNKEEEQILPSEAREIVVMEEEEEDGK